MNLRLPLFLMLTAGPCLADQAAGIAYLTGESEEGRNIALSIWYPSDEPPSAEIGGNAVFLGVPAAPDAALPEAPLPVVILSHGGLRSAADSGAWLSSSIARAGFIVAEINAPRPENGAAGINEIWRRPQDMRRAIDLMLDSEDWGGRIDQENISVVGFALGATAALSVAGAGLNVDHYLQSCAPDDGAAGPDCGWYAAQGVSLAETDMEALAGLQRDPRVSSVVAIEPEYPAALSASSVDLAGLLVSLGEKAPALQDGANPIQVETVPQATVFDAFAACTEAGPKILLDEEGDASLCGESADARQRIHADMAKTITSFLGATGK
ncbi:alpha/beta hydrolase family protein [Paracoccus xiamenensis]|uniref:alpha/beta hydrolase family protein n=1 Tax=Paracoccus xiamenensis TaxID=2714901 RepID=UPI00140BBE9A|nr:hypothetical protein [Paracoccus xiamenensis]NHF74051.1 hypothetical protein [Paracoccus xiamenensis]